MDSCRFHAATLPKVRICQLHPQRQPAATRLPHHSINWGWSLQPVSGRNAPNQMAGDLLFVQIFAACSYIRINQRVLPESCAPVTMMSRLTLIGSSFATVPYFLFLVTKSGTANFVPSARTWLLELRIFRIPSGNGLLSNLAAESADEIVE